MPVPPFVLQPLVENALRHGDPGPDREARVDIRAVRENGRLLLEVRDNGPGLRVTPDEALTGGIGLSTTRRRLERLYGEAGTLALVSGERGGLCVRLTMPARVDEARPA